jgi:SAM domain (Sterile alpha motif)
LEILDWLRCVGLERYAQAFRDAENTTEVLPELTDGDLRELGLPLGPRKIFLRAVQDLSKPTPPTAPEQTQADTEEAARTPDEAERRLSQMRRRNGRPVRGLSCKVHGRRRARVFRLSAIRRG